MTTRIARLVALVGAGALAAASMISLPALAASARPAEDAGDASAKVPAGVVTPAFFAAHGIKVMAYQKGPGGLNVWQVEHNGMQTVFYSTSDNRALISGVLWDASSGTVESDAFITPAMLTPDNIERINGTSVTSGAAIATTFTPAPPVAAVNAAPGGLAVPISGVEALKGIREGRASPAKTVYIVFDPRCPHCRNVYDQSRDFIAHGGSIKWIPVTVLGNPPDGLNHVAAILQARDPVNALKVVEHSAMIGQFDVKPETVRAVGENEAYFWAAYDRNPGAGTPGVPVAFFQAKDGSPQMVGNVDDPALLQRIFGDMK
jgi:thiol:disulfide interchange protein DsbG